MIEKKNEEHEKCLKLMKEIIEKKNRGENIDDLYERLLSHRKKRDIFTMEEKLTIE